MTITATLAGAISMLGNFAFFFGGNRDHNNPLGSSACWSHVVAPLAAMLVQMAISRTREYSADRRGAEISGNPLWLASALDKIARTAEHIDNPAPNAIRRPPISSSSIRCRANAWTTVLHPPEHRQPHRGTRGHGAANPRTGKPAAGGASARRGPKPGASDHGADRPDPKAVVVMPAAAGMGEGRGRSVRQHRSGPGRAHGGGKAARRRDRRQDAARRTDRP